MFWGPAWYDSLCSTVDAQTANKSIHSDLFSDFLLLDDALTELEVQLQLDDNLQDVQLDWTS